MPNPPSKILLAEDDRFLRRAADAALRRHGFTMFVAADGEEALRVARQELPDLILLDLIMPKLQGFEVLRELKTSPHTSSIPVVVLSNLGQEKDSQITREMGAVDFWIKADIQLEELVKRTEAVLAGRHIS